MLGLNWFKFNENCVFVFLIVFPIAWSVCDQKVFFSLIDWIVLKIILQISSRNLIVMCILFECVCFIFVQYSDSTQVIFLSVSLFVSVWISSNYSFCSRVLHDFLKHFKCWSVHAFTGLCEIWLRHFYLFSRGKTEKSMIKITQRLCYWTKWNSNYAHKYNAK